MSNPSFLLFFVQLFFNLPPGEKKRGQGNRQGKLAVFREISGKGQKEDFQPFLRAETYSDRFLSRWLAGNRFLQKKRLPP